MNLLITAMKQAFPSKAEVVTKEDLKNLVNNDQFQEHMKNVVTKEELSEQIKLLYKMLEYLPSRDYFDKRMDELMTEIKAVRE